MRCRVLASAVSFMSSSRLHLPLFSSVRCHHLKREASLAFSRFLPATQHSFGCRQRNLTLTADRCGRQGARNSLLARARRTWPAAAVFLCVLLMLVLVLLLLMLVLSVAVLQRPRRGAVGTGRAVLCLADAAWAFGWRDPAGRGAGASTAARCCGRAGPAAAAHGAAATALEHSLHLADAGLEGFELAGLVEYMLFPDELVGTTNAGRIKRLLGGIVLPLVHLLIEIGDTVLDAEDVHKL